MPTCRLYIVDTHFLLSQEAIENLYGIQSNSDMLYKQYVDCYINTAKCLGQKEINPPPGLLTLYKEWAVRDACKCSVHRMRNVWVIRDPELTVDSIGQRAEKISKQLSGNKGIEKSPYVMYVTWESRTKLVVSAYVDGHLAFMHVSDNNPILHVDYQCNAEQLCLILEKPLCNKAFAYCNERDPLKALYLFTCLLGFCPV